MNRFHSYLGASLLLVCVATGVCSAGDVPGYYRFPAIYQDRVVFTSAGQLWSAPIQGGIAQLVARGATHAAFSPDGKTLAFSANYDGPAEVYTMPATGGAATRRTYDGAVGLVVGWTAGGDILYSTARYSSLPDAQLASLGPDGRTTLLPLSQAASGCYGSSPGTLFFTRFAQAGMHARSYRGGLAQNIWKFRPPAEAFALLPQSSAVSKEPICSNSRVFFVSDRDGTFNLWSMDENGRDLRQLTHHRNLDVETPSLSNGRVVYKLGADLRILNIATGEDTRIDILLPQNAQPPSTRIVKRPLDYATAVHLSANGDALLLVSRGKLFRAPLTGGRLEELGQGGNGWYRDARATPDGKSVAALSSATGEVELWRIPLNAAEERRQLTNGGQVLRWEAIPSPDGRLIAHQDKNNRLWVTDTQTGTERLIAESTTAGNSLPAFASVRWSPAGRSLLYTQRASNGFYQVVLYDIDTAVSTALTTDRYNSVYPAWGGGGDKIYFASDRALRTLVRSPTGPRQPEPFFDRAIKLYEVDAGNSGRAESWTERRRVSVPIREVSTRTAQPDRTGSTVPVRQAATASAQLRELPLPPSNYDQLLVAGRRLCWLNRDRAHLDTSALQCVTLGLDRLHPEALLEGVRAFEVSTDGTKMLVFARDGLYVINSDATAASLTPEYIAKSKVDTSQWEFTVDTVAEFREIFRDSWRLHRDYYYDRNLRGLNWEAIRQKYEPLARRARDRTELSDVIAMMVSELSSSHAFVSSGDSLSSPRGGSIGALGARISKDDHAGGFVIERIYRSDPDRPDRQSPLNGVGIDAADGDVIVAVNGRSAASAVSIGELLQEQAGKLVTLTLRPDGKSGTREVKVPAISVAADADLRYNEWEYSRRTIVEERSKGRFGYVHLRGMGPTDFDRFAEEFYPAFDRDGLIIDVRHNTGGNIDSWILERLLRKAWFYWQPRLGQPAWNMPYAFRGHVVVLCDQRTASDGEALAEGVRRLHIGAVIGMRTWGGGIWGSSSNSVLDRGIVTAAEVGVFSEDGRWIIEGHGVDPDIVVDNAPHASFGGRDAQLQAAIKYLERRVRERPVTSPVTPAYPVAQQPSAAHP